MLPKVSFGVVNCNRLFYLQSCVESLLETTKDYDNKDIIVVDNASVEVGTVEYLRSLESRGITVLRKHKRDFANEYPIALNDIVRTSTGDYVCPLQGDTQFVLDGWLYDVVNFYEKNVDKVGSIILDAQRRVTHSGHVLVRDSYVGTNAFFYDLSRERISPAADALYHRSVLNKVGPWSEDNKNHEGSMDSENDMRYRVRSMALDCHQVVPAIPQSIAIYTDLRGTQGRVRGNRRYGDYWRAKDQTGWKYYEFIDHVGWSLDRPNSIEDVANPIGFQRSIDSSGNWLKNPVRPELATKDDYVDL